MTIDEYDPRDGGRYRYTHHDPEGNTYTFHGVFHGDPSLEGAVQTFEYEGAPERLKQQSQGGAARAT